MDPKLVTPQRPAFVRATTSGRFPDGISTQGLRCVEPTRLGERHLNRTTDSQ